MLGNEGQRLFNVNAGLIRLTNLLAVDRQVALGEVNENTALLGAVEGDLTSCLKITTVDGGICMECHHILKILTGGYRKKLVLPCGWIIRPLVVCGFESGLVRVDPDLVEVNGRVSEVKFRVRKAGAGGHSLYVPCLDDCLVSHTVLMGHLTLENNGYDFHFLMGMRGKSGAWFNHIIVEYP